MHVTNAHAYIQQCHNRQRTQSRRNRSTTRRLNQNNRVYLEIIKNHSNKVITTSACVLMKNQLMTASSVP